MVEPVGLRESVRPLLGFLAITSLALAACRSTPPAPDGTLALETHRFT